MPFRSFAQRKDALADEERGISQGDQEDQSSNTNGSAARTVAQARGGRWAYATAQNLMIP